MFLSDLSIRRPVFALVLMLILVALGLFSYRRLSVDMYPDVDIPIVSVVTLYKGASPETVEREVTKRIEEAVNPISGVRHVMSVSRESVSTVVVEFNLEVNVDDAAQDVRAKISGIRRDLPASLEEPVVQKLDFAGMPVVSLAAKSNGMSYHELSDLVEKKIKRRIESLFGVGKVELVGLMKREVRVDIDPMKLEALGMGVDQVIAGIKAENLSTPLGRLKDGKTEYPMRMSGKPVRVGQFNTLVLGKKNNRPVMLDDVSEIRDSVEEQRTCALVNGAPAVGLDILKQSGANTVDVVDRVTKAAAELRKELPQSVSLDVVRDGSVMIRDSVQDVRKTLIEGGILTILIVFVFLNSWRSTVITGMTLPIAVISSFIVMHFMGMSLNIMTLMALSLAIGMLIDDAIVVRENIVRHLEMGKDHVTAAREGTSEIGLAVLATTFSIVAVFVPVAFMKGVVGRFFFQFGITVTFAVLVSLLVSFTLDPMLSSRWVDPDLEKSAERGSLARWLDRFNAWFDRNADRYKILIAWALDHRKTVVVSALVFFILGIGGFMVLPASFLQEYDRGEFQINLTTSPSASIEETRDRVNAVIAELEEIPEIHHTYATIGAGNSATVRDGKIYIKLVEKDRRKKTQADIQRDVRHRLKDIPGIEAALIEAGRLRGAKKLEFSIRGDDIGLLKSYAARMKNQLRKAYGVTDLEVSMEDDTPEYRLTVDRERATDAGVTSAMIARTVGTLVGGEAATTFEDDDGDAVNVKVRLPEELRKDPSQVERLRLSIRDSQGRPELIELGDLVDYTLGTTPSEINRRDLVREVRISANLDGTDMGTVMKTIRRAGDELGMAPGYRIVFSGEAEDMVESFTSMAEALVMAVIFVYLILAAQFESFIEPFSIMFSLPLSLVGMAATLFITGDALNIMSLIGLIMLMGLVTKNAILLIDYAKLLRKGGMDRREALITAGRVRLRPIMMTTLAMIVGMLPLALGLGAGAEMRAPMGRAVIGGLVTSTLLTLVVVPVMYTLLEDFGILVGRRWEGLRHRTPVGVGMILVFMFSIMLCTESSSAGEIRTLNLSEALRIASEKNKDIRLADEYRHQVEGRYVEERAAAFPKFSLNASYVTSKDDTQLAISPMIPTSQHYYGAELTLNQPLFTWGQIGAAVKAAEIGVRTADDQMQRSRQVVARDVSTAFYDVLLAREFHSIALDNLERKTRHLAEAKIRMAAGTATDYDVLSAEVAVSNARPDVIRAENRVAISKERLGLFLGLDGRSFNVDGGLDVEPGEVPDGDAMMKTALAKRPELMELEHRIGMQNEMVRVYRAMDKPRIDLFASYGWKDLTVEKAGRKSSEAGNVAKGGVQMTFPFFDGMKSRGKTAQNLSDLATLKLQEEKLKDTIRLQTEESLNVLKESYEILNALKGVAARAERLLTLAEQGFAHGVKTPLDVQDAQLALKDARVNLAKARRDCLTARVVLDWVTGTLNL